MRSLWLGLICSWVLILCCPIASPVTVLELIHKPENTLIDLSQGDIKCKNISHSIPSATFDSHGNSLYSICCVFFTDSVKSQLSVLENLLPSTYRPLHLVDLRAMYRKGTVKCLPSFIIAGTQKSGTTALSAFLSSHPSVAFSPKKEVHFFDRKFNVMSGIPGYLRSFPALSFNQSLQKTPPLYGESSPFYIASRTACKEISLMLPNVKLIILLREPSSRAYSEYHMKKRRVDQQNDFISLVSSQATAVFDCLLSERYPTWHEMETYCLSKNITSHNHYAKFLNSFPSPSSLKSKPKSREGKTSGDVKNLDLMSKNSSFLDKSHLLWRSTVSRCFSTSPEADQSSNDRPERHNRASNKERMLSYDSNEEYCDHNNCDENEYDDIDETANWNGGRSEEKNPPSSNAIMYHNSSINEDGCWRSHTFDTNSKYTQLYESEEYLQMNKNTLRRDDVSSRYLRRQRSSSGSHGTSDYINKLLLEAQSKRPDTNKRPDLYFQPKQCMSKNARETLNPLLEAFQGEIQTFQNCLFRNSTDSLEQLDADIDRCLKVKSGISGQYFYRSLYGPQLYNCFKYIDRSNFLIISKEELEKNPATVIKSVLKFLNLEDVSDADMSTEFIQNAVAKFFPKFESLSGWRLNSEYEPIPKTLDEYLKDFFKPYNRLLDDMLQTNFSQLWYQ